MEIVGDVTLSGLFTVPYFCRSFSINLSAGDNVALYCWSDNVGYFDYRF